MSSNLSDVDLIVGAFEKEAMHRGIAAGSEKDCVVWLLAADLLKGIKLGLEQATRVANARCKPDPRQQCGVAGCEGKSEYIHNLQFLYTQFSIGLCYKHSELTRESVTREVENA